MKISVSKNFLNSLKYDGFSFLYNSHKNIGVTGAIAPTGKQVTQEIIKYIENDIPQCIVEIGSGTGVFTESILKTMHPNSILICIEINTDFVSKLQLKYPQAHIYCDSAEKTEHYIKKHGYDCCDIIISGLPWVSFEKKMQESLLSHIHACLEKGGKFSTFAYTGFHKTGKGRNFAHLVLTTFSHIDTSKTYFSNTPPAFVYHCTK